MLTKSVALIYNGYLDGNLGRRWALGCGSEAARLSMTEIQQIERRREARI
jgi:hypothetical protein